MSEKIYNFCLLILVIIVLFFLIISFFDLKEGMGLTEDVGKVKLAYAYIFQAAAAASLNITVTVNSDNDSDDDQTIEENAVETLCNEILAIDNDNIKNYMDPSHKNSYHKTIINYLEKKKKLQEKSNGNTNFEMNFKEMIHYISENESQKDLSLEMTNIFICDGKIRNITIDYLDSKIQEFNDPYPEDTHDSIITELFNEISGNYDTSLNTQTDIVGYTKTSAILDLDNPLSENFSTMENFDITSDNNSESTQVTNARSLFNKLVLKKKLQGLTNTIIGMKNTLETNGNKGGQFLTIIIIPALLIGENYLYENKEVPSESDIDICNLTSGGVLDFLGLFPSNDCSE